MTRSAPLALLVPLLSALPAAQASPTPVRRRTALYEQVAHPDSRRTHARLAAAHAALERVLQRHPSSYQSLCVRALALPLASAGAAVTAGRKLAVQAFARAAEQRRGEIEQVLAELEQALARDPGDPELHHARARALDLWERPLPAEACEVERRDRDAIAALQTVTELDETFAAGGIAFDLAILWTRAHDYARAAAAYERALLLAWDETRAATIHANLAEVRMLAGDLPAAITSYERAVLLAQGGRDYTLALLGLAVARDRSGDHAAALASARKAVEAEGRTLLMLYADGVFFEPSYERHFYDGLGHESLAQLLPDHADRELRAALRGYEAFCANAPEADVFRAVALANAARIRERLK